MNRSKQRKLEEPKKNVSTTCTNCRERHLKCDGGPVCSRCRADDRQCVFVLSRRGRRPSIKHGAINKAARLSDLRSSTRSEGENVETASELTIPEGSNQSSSRSNSQLRRWMTDVPDRFDSVDFSNTSDVEEVLDGFPAIKPAKTVHSAHLLDIFYSRVFFSHPFILPRKYLVEEFERGDLGHLQAAIEYIASFHDPAMQTGHFRDAANSALLNRSLTPNVYMVQALLLFAIALHFGKESTLASSTLSQAIELAVELGMNNRQFNTGDVSSVYEESWRRTWWELYIFDGYLVSLRLRAHFTLHSIPSDVLLPCDDLEYVTGKIPPSRSLEEYQTKICPAFYDDRFSSYTCRIDSVRIFGKLQRPDQLYGLSLSSSPQLSPVSASNSSINQASVIVTQSDTTTPSNESKWEKISANRLAPLPRSCSSSVQSHDDYHSQHSGTAQRSTNATERIAFQQPEPDESRFPQQDVHQSPTVGEPSISPEPQPAQPYLRRPLKRAGSDYWSFMPSRFDKSWDDLSETVYDFGGFADSPYSSATTNSLQSDNSELNISYDTWLIKLPLDKTFGIVSSNAHSTLYLGGEIQKLFAIPKGCEFFGLNGEQMSPFFYLPSRSNPKHPPAPKWWNADFFIPGTRTLSPEILSRFEGPLATLLPTPAQLNYPHPYWIDTVPIPQLREAIIIALYHAPQLLDEMELIMDFCDAGGKFRGGGHFCDPKNWEIGDNFWLKWGFLVSPDMMRQTDRWRRMRGLPSITTSGRPGDLAITGIPGRRSKVFNYVPEEV
ncbi:C6 transcription factor [Histoplasma capsulatum var. duboisii H88]|uniref:C6 transcription factor n=1 Tax=Ajellomyces capsulatus (strain H88) TaxID=544711 RepID=F0UK25_AJEC8|nr:C6 transcription factor [Histoplasma capsulatum var. duboisii H88]QSS56496.1 C6 transcription factor [Histoplasma capsulatum var. duboisii H88]